MLTASEVNLTINGTPFTSYLFFLNHILTLNYNTTLLYHNRLYILNYTYIYIYNIYKNIVNNKVIILLSIIIF